VSVRTFATLGAVEQPRQPLMQLAGRDVAIPDAFERPGLGAIATPRQDVGWQHGAASIDHGTGSRINHNYSSFIQSGTLAQARSTSSGTASGRRAYTSA
jgi:hypothetical protein